MSHALAVFVSGTGRHMQNFARLSQSGELAAHIGLVLCNRANAGALERAAALDLPTKVLDPNRELDDATFSARAFEAVEEAGCETVLLAGFLRKLVVPPHWHGRVLNIHPALLPAFGGKGYWGSRVHKAVLERGCWYTGCTVHYVDDEYDHGPILLQRVLRVNTDGTTSTTDTTDTTETPDTPETLAARVFEEELIAYPEAVRLHLAGEKSSAKESPKR